MQPTDEYTGQIFKARSSTWWTHLVHSVCVRHVLRLPLGHVIKPLSFSRLEKYMVGPPLSALAAAALAEASSPDMELIRRMDLSSTLQSVRKSPSNSII